MSQRLIYSVPFFIAALSIFIVALFAFRRRKIRGAWFLTLVCLSGAVWAAFEGLRNVGLDLKTDMLATYAQYLGVIPLSGLSLFFGLSVFGYDRWVNRSNILIFILITGALLVLVWTDPLHHLVYTRFYLITHKPFPIQGFERGILGWIIIGYLYVFTSVLGALLIKVVLTTSGIMRSQASVVLAAVCVVSIVNLVYITGHSPLQHIDISPLSFILVAISMAWGFFRYNLLDILPIARTEIFHGLNDPIVVLDPNDRVLDLNPAAESLLEIQASKSIGQNIALIANSQPELPQLLLSDQQQEICIRKNGEMKYFDVNKSLLKDMRGMKIGRIITFYDNTERILAAKAERERERLRGVLEMAGAVCHDLSQPIMAILGYVELILNRDSQSAEIDGIDIKLSRQAEKVSDLSKKLMGITRYETKILQGNQIIDIEKASSSTSEASK